MTLSSSSWSTTIDRPANHGTSSRGSLRFGANRRKPSERDAPRLLRVHTDFVYGSDTYWRASTIASFRDNSFFKPSGINLDASCPTRRWSFRSSGRRMTAFGRKRTIISTFSRLIERPLWPRKRTLVNYSQSKAPRRGRRAPLVLFFEKLLPRDTPNYRKCVKLGQPSQTCIERWF